MAGTSYYANVRRTMRTAIASKLLKSHVGNYTLENIWTASNQKLEMYNYLSNSM